MGLQGNGLGKSLAGVTWTDRRTRLQELNGIHMSTKAQRATMLNLFVRDGQQLCHAKRLFEVACQMDQRPYHLLSPWSHKGLEKGHSFRFFPPVLAITRSGQSWYVHVLWAHPVNSVSNRCSPAHDVSRKRTPKPVAWQVARQPSSLVNLNCAATRRC